MNKFILIFKRIFVYLFHIDTTYRTMPINISSNCQYLIKIKSQIYYFLFIPIFKRNIKLKN